MSGKVGTRASTKRRRSRQTNKQNGAQTSLPHSTNNNTQAWKVFWKTQGQSWRTEPEIDEERQKYLAERRKIAPNIKQGIYPFKDIKLSRADVEWLLATHENGQGPVDWSDKNQHNRKGLDLRGAILKDENLSALPLAGLQGGLSREELQDVGIEHREALMEAAAIHLEGEGIDSMAFDYRFLSDPDNEGLCDTHLEGAELSGAFLTNATLFGTFLIEAHLYRAHLEDTDLRQAHLEEADLDSAYLMKAHLDKAYFAKATLSSARMDEAWLPEANLEGANLFEVTLNKAHLWKARLKGARLYNASLRGAELKEVNLAEANLTKASLEETSLVEAHLERANLEYAHLEGANLLGSHLEGARCCRAFFDGATRLNDIILSGEKDGCISLAEVSWGSVNLTVVDWTQLKVIGDELQAHQREWNNGEIKKPEIRLEQYKAAIRANRQLAVVLRDQGLNEEADHFAYRAKILQRQEYVLQVLKVSNNKEPITRPFLFLVSLFLLMLLPTIPLGFFLVKHQPYPLLIILERLTLGSGVSLLIVLFLLFLFMLRIALLWLLEKEVKKNDTPILLLVIVLFSYLIFIILIPIVYLPPILLSLFSWLSSVYGELVLEAFIVISSILILLWRLVPRVSWLPHFILQILQVEKIAAYFSSQFLTFFKEMSAYGQYAFSLFLDLLAGYGYKPRRSVVAYLVVIIGFDILYYAFSQKVGPHLSPVGSLILSISSFHGRGFFPGAGITLDDPMTILAAAEAVIGLIIEISFIATFTQKFFGK